MAALVNPRRQNCLTCTHYIYAAIIKLSDSLWILNCGEERWSRYLLLPVMQYALGFNKGRRHSKSFRCEGWYSLATSSLSPQSAEADRVNAEILCFVYGNKSLRYSSMDIIIIVNRRTQTFTRLSSFCKEVTYLLSFRYTLATMVISSLSKVPSSSCLWGPILWTKPDKLKT